MPETTIVAEEFKVYIDVAHTAGGVWNDPGSDWQQLRSKMNLTSGDGVRVAEFDFHGDADMGARRSLRRKPELTLEVGMLRGNAAYDRFMQAANDRLNGGLEILRIRIVEGLITTSGAFYDENDFVVTANEFPGGGNEPGKRNFTLMRAADSPNAPVYDGVIA